MKELVFVRQSLCAPCTILKPIVENACIDFDIPLRYVDVTDNWELAKEMQVQSTPTLIVVDNGEEVGRIEVRRAVPLRMELRKWWPAHDA